MRHLVSGVALVCATFGSAPRLGAEPSAGYEVTVEVAPSSYDGLQVLLDEEARLALAEGKYRRARRLFLRLLEIDPADVRAMRELGRLAHAIGDLEEAVEVLGRVDSLDGTAPDPELHFLRGEALHALGRTGEAEDEFVLMERDLEAAPVERRGTLWRARVAVLQGDHDKALELYQPLLDDRKATPAQYEEIVLLVIETHILKKDWARAEALIRDFLAGHPDHERGKALLAWTLEASGQVEEELALRAEAARDAGDDDPSKTLEYARALERAHDYPGALDHYRAAQALGVAEAADGIRRLEKRYSPEIGGGVLRRTDPSGAINGWVAGATAPLGQRLRIAVSATGESSSGGFAMEQREAITGTGWAAINTRRGTLLAAGITVRENDVFRQIGGSGLLQSSPLRDVQLQLRGDYNVPWHESASTLRDGGVMDTAGATLYFKSSVSERKLLASVGVQGRRLGLEPRPGETMARANQLFTSAGADIVLQSDPSRAARGELLDNDMLGVRALISSTVLSYRHYETFSDDPFGLRLALVERSSIDEVSGVVRRVFDRKGRVAAEVRGGLGYDWVRYVEQWRAGGSLLLSATQTSRFTFDYDVASESGTGLEGRRHIGQVVLHVDL
jgi:tetratricopeptide (TPR) repeat protein